MGHISVPLCERSLKTNGSAANTPVRFSCPAERTRAVKVDTSAAKCYTKERDDEALSDPAFDSLEGGDHGHRVSLGTIAVPVA